MQELDRIPIGRGRTGCSQTRPGSWTFCWSSPTTCDRKSERSTTRRGRIPCTRGSKLPTLIPSPSGRCCFVGPMPSRRSALRVASPCWPADDLTQPRSTPSTKRTGGNWPAIWSRFHSSSRTKGTGLSGLEKYSTTDPDRIKTIRRPGRKNIARFRRIWRITGTDRSVSWRAVPPLERESIQLPDDYVADEAVKLLKEVGPSARDGSENFFAAVGFYKPHLPFVFPRQYLDLYPENEIKLPRRSRVPDAMPDIAWNNWEISKYPDIAALNLKEGTPDVTLPANVTRQLRRAYYGAVSYVDDLVGRVVRQLDAEGLRNNTVVVFLGDHGWHLGESNFWGKHTNFELATWAPLIISIPAMTSQGIVSDIPVEFVDLFPTVVEAAGFPAIPACPADKTELLCTEGESLLGLIPGSGKYRQKRVAFSQYPRRGFSIMGYSVRTDRFRYTEWIRKKRSDSRPDRLRTIYATELYDHYRDPDETTNRFNDSSYSYQMVHLRRMLQAGWRGAVFPDLQIPGLRQRIRHVTVPPSRKRSGHPIEDLNSVEPNERNFDTDNRSPTMGHERCLSRRDCKRKFKRLSKFPWHSLDWNDLVYRWFATVSSAAVRYSNLLIFDFWFVLFYNLIESNYWFCTDFVQHWRSSRSCLLMIDTCQTLCRRKVDSYLFIYYRQLHDALYIA